MITGYLMFDNSEQLENKIERAIRYHVKKTGITPDLCLVNIGDFKKGEYLVTTRPYRSIPKFHIWVGVENGTPD